MITENPMTRLERRTVGSLALLYSFRMLGLFMVLPLLALYAVDFPDASPVMLGLALGIYGLSQAALQIPLGWLSDRVGRKPVIVGGLLVFALGSVVAGQAESVLGIVVGRFLQGAGAIASTVMALAADLTSEEQRTKAMAIVGASIGASFAVALVLGPAVAAGAGLAGVFYLTAVLAVLGVLIVIYLVPTPDRTGDYWEVGAQSQYLTRALFDPQLLRLNFGVFSLHFMLMASFLLVPTLLQDVLQLPRDNHWQVYLPVLLLSVLGVLPMLRLAERSGYLREVFAAAIVMILLAMLGLALTGGATWFYLSLWLFFVGFNYLEATLPSLVSKAVFANGRGTAMGIFASCQFLGAFAGGAIGGYALQQWGSVGVLASCAAVGLTWLLLNNSRQETATEATGDLPGA